MPLCCEACSNESKLGKLKRASAERRADHASREAETNAAGAARAKALSVDVVRYVAVAVADVDGAVVGIVVPVAHVKVGRLVMTMVRVMVVGIVMHWLVIRVVVDGLMVGVVVDGLVVEAAVVGRTAENVVGAVAVAVAVAVVEVGLVAVSEVERVLNGALGVCVGHEGGLQVQGVLRERFRLTLGNEDGVEVERVVRKLARLRLRHVRRL